MDGIRQVARVRQRRAVLARVASAAPYAGQNAQEHLAPSLAYNVRGRGQEAHSRTDIRQESHADMAIHAPVLIVEGNPQMTILLQRFLARQQVETQGVLSPAEAHIVLAQQPFRVVLTDYFAPSGDGLALLRALRQLVPSPRGILMAAFGTAVLRDAALADGAYAYLAKPFRLQDLWDIVQPALQGLPAPGEKVQSAYLC